MSDTPRIDGKIASFIPVGGDPEIWRRTEVSKDWYFLEICDFARQLERELNALSAPQPSSEAVGLEPAAIHQFLSDATELQVFVSRSLGYPQGDLIRDCADHVLAIAERIVASLPQPSGKDK